MNKNKTRFFFISLARALRLFSMKIVLASRCRNSTLSNDKIKVSIVRWVDCYNVWWRFSFDWRPLLVRIDQLRSMADFSIKFNEHTTSQPLDERTQATAKLKANEKWKWTMAGRANDEVIDHISNWPHGRIRIECELTSNRDFLVFIERTDWFAYTLCPKCADQW